MIKTLSELNDFEKCALMTLAYVDIVAPKRAAKMTVSEAFEHLPASVQAKYKDALNSVGAYEIVKYENNSITGFGAIALNDSLSQNYTGNTAILFRGSDGIELDSLNDWIDNLSYTAIGTSVQTQQALKFYENLKKVGEVHLFGHSKGGALASEVFGKNFENIKKLTVLNPQPPYANMLTFKEIAAFNSERVDCIVAAGDYVSILGSLPYKNVRTVKSKGDAHQLTSVTFDDGNCANTNKNFAQIVCAGLGAFAVYMIQSNLFSIAVKLKLLNKVHEFVGYINQNKEVVASYLKQLLFSSLDKAKSISRKIIIEIKQVIEKIFQQAKNKLICTIKSTVGKFFSGSDIHDFGEPAKDAVVTVATSITNRENVDLFRWNSLYGGEKWFSRLNIYSAQKNIEKAYSEFNEIQSEALLKVKRKFEMADNLEKNYCKSVSQYNESAKVIAGDLEKLLSFT